jgi:hypothetical protein
MLFVSAALACLPAVKTVAHKAKVTTPKTQREDRCI